MISYQKHTLSNGLTVLTHRDEGSQLAALNLIYRVGARNENPKRTGFAHLFEHLMFGGSINIPDFDLPLQRACGENNAFTNNDYTDYYITLPKENLDTAFWLESDRMLGLAFDPKSLEVQRKVVIEEFNQRYLNQPYGDLWLLLRPLVYTTHPYRWATIGTSPEQIETASMEEVRAFYERYYNPNNAILSVVADLPHEQLLERVEHWFGGISRGIDPQDNIPQEPIQREARRLSVERDVPTSVVTIAFHMGDRLSREFNVCDVISDLLSGGTSSRLHQRLIQQEGLCSSVNAYVTGDVDPGLFVITGHLMPDTTPEVVEAAFWEELERFKTETPSDYELDKVRNKYESDLLFGEINVMNKAMNLGFYEMLGDLPLINREVEAHNSVSPDEMRATASHLFRPENSSTLLYLKSDKHHDTAR